MITRINNNPQQNTFGVKFSTKNTKIDKNLSDYSKKYVETLLKELHDHNKRVSQDPHANQDVVELAHINLVPQVRHITDISQTLGLHVKKPGQILDPYTETRLNTHVTVGKAVKDMSDYWDRITGFKSKKPQIDD